MEVDVFSMRDLRQRSGELIKEAEDGHLALITKHGRPAILAVPFDDRLLELGVHRTLALHLFEQRHLTLVQAARLAGMTAEEFMSLLGEAGVPAVDYPPDELEDEMPSRTGSAPHDAAGVGLPEQLFCVHRLWNSTSSGTGSRPTT